ncbi:MAG: hypothetical protein Q8M03_15715 [Legionella sp.]|nr:hypothetical protein [Legionella sp.]
MRIHRFIFSILLMAHGVVHAAQALSYTVLFTGKDGGSYFKKATTPLSPAKVGLTSMPVPTKKVFFGKSGDFQDWHNAPEPLYIIVLSGVMQIETSKSVVKNFKAGEILLAKDLTGKGHITRALNNEKVDYIAMALEG